MARYIGVTIGPIDQTIAAARSTGELWGSSYIFSYLIKKMIINMVKNKKTFGSYYLIPYIPDNLNEPPLGGYNEAGLFPDRLIFKVDDNLANPLEMVHEIREKTLREFASKIAKESQKDHAYVHRYITQYFRIYAVLYTADDDRTIVKEINHRLDALELYARAVPCEKENYLAKLLLNKNIRNSFLYRDAFGPDLKEPLPLMHHIAAGGSGADIAAIESEAQNNVKQALRKLLTNPVKNEMPYTKLLNLLDERECEMQKMEDWLQENKDSGDRNFMAEIGQTIFSRQTNFFSIMKDQSYNHKAFKYVGVVKADGDGVGTYISSFTARKGGQIRKLSEQLFQFGQVVLEKIKEYGGKPIYIGGDDLLFIAPVLSIKEKEEEKENRVKTIFDLIDDLSDCFQDILNLDNSRDNAPHMSLSFGITMTYYGYPLYESLRQADSCLKKAKDNRVFLHDKEAEKNALCVSLIKHSGSSSNLIFNQDSQGYKRFKQMLRTSFPYKACPKQEKFLKGMMHKLQMDRVILSEILKDKDYEVRLKNYFDNSFDEKVHQQPHIKDYFNAVKELICIMSAELWEEKIDTSSECVITNPLSKEETVINGAVACLRMIKFFQEEGDE